MSGLIPGASRSSVTSGKLLLFSELQLLLRQIKMIISFVERVAVTIHRVIRVITHGLFGTACVKAEYICVFAHFKMANSQGALRRQCLFVFASRLLAPAWCAIGTPSINE